MTKKHTKAEIKAVAERRKAIQDEIHFLQSELEDLQLELVEPVKKKAKVRVDWGSISFSGEIPMTVEVIEYPDNIYDPMLFDRYAVEEAVDAFIRKHGKTVTIAGNKFSVDGIDFDALTVVYDDVEIEV